MTIERKTRVFDLVGDLGVGVVEDVYVNYHDDPQGETLAVCRFGDDGDEETICDRALDQISADPALTGVPATPSAPTP